MAFKKMAGRIIGRRRKVPVESGGFCLVPVMGKEMPGKKTGPRHWSGSLNAESLARFG